TELPLRDFLVNVLSLSPHLREAASLDPGILAEALAGPLEPIIARLVAEARNAWVPGEDGSLPSEAEVMSRLRMAKRKASLLIALADLARFFDGRATTRWLSELAEAAISAAIDHLLLSAHDGGKLKLRDRAAPSEGSGLIVLGMGKLGAGELNY